MNITIVIVAEDQGDLPSLFNSLKKNLESVENLSQKPNFEIVLVGEKRIQNGRFFKKEVKFLKPNSNSLTGKFAQACQTHPADYYLLLEATSRLLPDCLQELIKTARKKDEVGLIIPKVVDNKEKSQPTCFRQISLSSFLNESKKNPYIPRGAFPTTVNFALGIGFLVPHQVIKFLNKDFFSSLFGFYLCKKIKRDELNCYYVPQAKIFYPLGQKSNKKQLDEKKLYGFFGCLSRKLIGYISNHKKPSRRCLIVIGTISTLITISLLVALFYLF